MLRLSLSFVVRQFAFTALLLMVSGSMFGVSSAVAQNPAWPNASANTPELLRDPANWPDDPGYGYDVRGDAGETCLGDGLRCWTNGTGGQWNMWSWVPPEAEANEEWRSAESATGAGTWTDMAWTLTTGNNDVVIAVLDSGIKWDERDLTNKFFINRAELEVAGLDVNCLPVAPAGHAGDPVDINGDGILSMRDWFFGKTAAESAALTATMDGMGNQNGIADPGDLITFCSDDVDDDGNGYVDDISGWDFHHDDNDPSDDTRFGHGTSEARWSAAEANNGMGRAGFCPDCQVLMVRVGDSFIVDAQDFGQAVIFSTDAGASVIQEALGSINGSTFMRRAVDYAYDRGVLVIASAADENSYHHNLPGTADHNLYVHAIRYAGASAQDSRSFLAFNNCTNYGAQLAASAPGTGCSSEATGVTAGIAGLVVSAAESTDRPGGPLDPPLSAEELRQVLLMETDDIWIPESMPDHADHDDAWYISHEGWDQRFGWGRINAYKSVLAVREGRIPPEVDLYGPDWFRVLYPSRDGSVTLQGKIDARRADSFDYVIEWASGIEPTDADFATLAMGVGETTAIEGDLTEWDISMLDIDNPISQGIHNRYTVTVRIRVTAHYGGDIGDVVGEQRRAFSIVPEETLLAGFPVTMGTRHASDLHAGASGESSPKLFDADGDGELEIIVCDADGLVHVYQEDGSELAGFPVLLGSLRGFDPADPTNIRGSRAYMTGEVPSDDIASSILATPAIGDLDGDGESEIVAVSMEGVIYAIGFDGVMRPGFPIDLPDVPSADPRRGGPSNEDSIVERGAFASPSLADLDSDGTLEIIVAAFDGKVHVFREDGSIQDGFPVDIVAEILWVDPDDAQPSRIMTSPAIGDVNGDGILDIAVGSNEYGDQSGTGAMHVIHGDGNNHAGGAEHTGWPIDIVSLELFPLVGRGTPSPIAMADTNGDGLPDLALTGTASRMQVFEGIQAERARGDDADPLAIMNSVVFGQLSVLDRTDTPLLNTFASGSFHDLDQDGVPDYVGAGAGLRLALNLAGGYENQPFTHMVGAWSSRGSSSRVWQSLPGFPKEIEDYLFFNNPSSADVDGDGYPEVITGSGGYYIHAWDACGEEAEGFPKFVGGWVIASVALGDVDGDDLLELVVSTRAGYLFVFDTNGSVNGSIGWPEFRHDNHNTANYDMPLAYGQRVTADVPYDCELPMTGDDAGVASDSGMTDDSGSESDAGVSPDVGSGVTGGSCDCRTAPGAGSSPWGLLLVAGLFFWRRRR